LPETEEVKPLKCPLCSVDMDYEKYKKTHIWVCPECPAVVFELWKPKDATNIKKRFNS